MCDERTQERKTRNKAYWIAGYIVSTLLGVACVLIAKSEWIFGFLAWFPASVLLPEALTSEILSSRPTLGEFKYLSVLFLLKIGISYFVGKAVRLLIAKLAIK